MSAAGWDVDQDAARRRYGFTRWRLLWPVLSAARARALNPDWREHLRLVVVPVERAEVDSDALALHEVGTMGVQPWEPHAGAGWRSALDSWYATVLEVEDCYARCSRWEAPAMKALVAKYSGDFEADVAEGRRRARDGRTAWYYAGLAAGGVNIDWRGWYRERIATWTTSTRALAGPTAAEKHTMLGTWRAQQMETLPAYWTMSAAA